MQNKFQGIENILKWLETAGVKQEGSPKQFDLSVSLIKEELDELITGYENNDKNEQTDAVADLIWVSLNWAWMNNLSIVEMLEKVEQSNYSKFCVSEQEAIDTVIAYSEGTHWDKMGVKIECECIPVGEFFVIKRKDNQKILKNINYTPVSKL